MHITSIIPGAGKRHEGRENRAKFWDVIAENSTTLVAIYGRILDGNIGPISSERRTRIETRRADCLSAESNAKQKATRIRCGLE